MTQEQLLSPALRSQLSTFIAEAVAKSDLPSLTRPEDQDFIGGIFKSVIDAFWRAYVGQLGEATQKQLAEAAEDETGEKIWSWLQKNADFEKNEGARLLAQEIMEDFSQKLSGIIAEAHPRFAEHLQQES